MGISARLAQLLAEAPDEAEVIETGSGAEAAWWTWGNLRAVARAVEETLEAAGLAGPGTRVGVVLENRPEHVGLLAAILAGERCVVTLSPLQPAARLSADIAR
ncbi:AMP-binding protein, partial [Pseudonocardia pini]|uniref:AMP-binding protein n=1 Tax=Pseudonocardia pini TaxID=2758030 RepID=UPI0015F02C9A